MNRTPRFTYVVFAILALAAILWVLGVFESKTPAPKPEPVTIVSVDDIYSLPFQSSEQRVRETLGDPARRNVAKVIQRETEKERMSDIYRGKPRNPNPVKIELGAIGASKCLSYQTKSDELDTWMLCFRGDRLRSKERLAGVGKKSLVIKAGTNS